MIDKPGMQNNQLHLAMKVAVVKVSESEWEIVQEHGTALWDCLCDWAQLCCINESGCIYVA